MIVALWAAQLSANRQAGHFCNCAASPKLDSKLAATKPLVKHLETMTRDV